jgi:FdhD protein
MIQPIVPIEYHQFSPGRWQAVSGNAIVERTVSLTVNNEVWLSFMCTPMDLEALAVGFLFNEGLISSMADIASVRLCASGDNVDVWTYKSLESPARWRRTSGCSGGATSVEDGEMASGMMPIQVQHWVFTPHQISELVINLFEGQTLYREAGGVHSSALSDGKRILVATEDVGRHNTLDKLAGRCLMEGIQVANGIILSTGRISSEMLQKAARLGAAVVISRTAASSLAIQMAQQFGITLIGYARRERFNVYTHPERVGSFHTQAIQAKRITHEQ